MNTKPKYVHPAVELSAFSCAHCGTLTSQFWSYALATNVERNRGAAPNDFDKRWTTVIGKPISDTYPEMVHRLELGRLVRERDGDCLIITNAVNGRRVTNVRFSECYECSKVTIWKGDEILWPADHEYPPPHSDLPPDLLRDYEEAGAVLAASPRGTAALLRLVVQKLCVELGEPGKNINTDIGSLVKKGLPDRVQKALDAVRVVGNNAVHPLQMDIQDNREIAFTLFKLVNLIVETMITAPKAVDDLYNSLPQEALKGIADRDKSPKA